MRGRAAGGSARTHGPPVNRPRMFGKNGRDSMAMVAVCMGVSSFSTMNDTCVRHREGRARTAQGLQQALVAHGWAHPPNQQAGQHST